MQVQTLAAFTQRFSLNQISLCCCTAIVTGIPENRLKIKTVGEFTLHYHCKWETEIEREECFFFFICRNSPTRAQAASLLKVSRLQTDTPPSVGLPWTSNQPSQRPLPDNTQHSQQADIHAPGGIRTRNPSKLAAAIPRLRPRSHRDRQIRALVIYCQLLTMCSYGETKCNNGVMLLNGENRNIHRNFVVAECITAMTTSSKQDVTVKRDMLHVA